MGNKNRCDELDGEFPWFNGFTVGIDPIEELKRTQMASESEEQPATNKGARIGTPARGPDRSHVWVFMVLLAAVVGLAVAIASGLLRFGLEGPIVYTLYCVAGLLAAILCYGLLESSGELHGERYGTTLRLGGAIVGFVVVAGGGGLYERFLRTPGVFSVRVTFYLEDPSVPSPIEADAIIRAMNRRYIEPVDKYGSALFGGLTSDMRESQAELALASDAFQLVAEARIITLTDTKPISAQVVRRQMFATEEEALVELSVADARTTTMSEAFTFRYALSFSLEAVNRSSKAVPIDSKGFLELKQLSGVPVKKIEVKVYSDLRGDGAFLPPDLPTSVFVEAPMYADLQSCLEKDYFATIHLVYDRVYGKKGSQFATSAFKFERHNLGFDEDFHGPADQVYPEPIESLDIEGHQQP